MIKLSIVTITFNDVATIEQTIKSVVDQNYSNQIKTFCNEELFPKCIHN